MNNPEDYDTEDSQERDPRSPAPKSVLRSVSADGSSTFDEPRSILRPPRAPRTRVNANFGGRRPRRRYVSFNAREQIFLIPSRRRLKEDQRRALRRQRLRRRLTMRQSALALRISANRKRQRRENHSHRRHESRRINRLALARKRYFRANRRRNFRRRQDLSDNSSDRVSIATNEDIPPRGSKKYSTVKGLPPKKELRRHTDKRSRLRKNRPRHERSDSPSPEENSD